METVALAWAQEGISTVAEAKKSNARYSKDYYSILKALGITNRSPVETEITLMDTWLKTYGFSIAIIQEACTRTVLQTGQASFQYTDKILEGWKKKQVKNSGGYPGSGRRAQETEAGQKTVQTCRSCFRQPL